MKIKSLKQASRAVFTPLVSAGVCICITTVHAADWDGSTSTAWNEGTNWSGDVVPSGVDVGIYTGASNFPVISANAGTILSISIGGWYGTGRLDQTAGSLSVQNGDWTHGWVLVGGNNYSTGIYNIANTATTGGTFTGYGTGSGSLSTGGDLRVGAGSWWPNATGLMNINTSGTVQVGGWLLIGGNGGAGTVNIDAGTVSTNGDTRVGADGSNSTGLLNINTSGTVSTNGQLAVGANSNNTGTVNIVAGTVTANNAWIGSGSATSTATGTLNISGGTLTLVNRLAIGVGNSTSGGVNVGTVTLTGGTLTTDANQNDWWNSGVNMASGYDTATGGTATFNLNGGTLSTLNVFSEGTKGTSIFNFNGGTLQGQANRDSLNGGQFMGNQSGYWQPVNDITRANVRNGGAVIDTNGFNLYVGQKLEHSNIGGDAAIDGGLTKNGAGQLEIAGANSFTGQVVVNSGTLYASTFDWNGGAAFGSASGITVNNGATLKANSNSLFGTYSSHAGPITVNAGGSAITQGGRQDVGLLTLNGGTLASSGSIGAGGSWMFGRFTDKKLLVTANSTVSAEKVVFRNGATIEVASGSKLDFTGTISDNSDGASAVIKTGSGTLVLAGANNYTGSTSVNSGTLALSNNSAAGTSAISLSGASAASLKITSGITVANNITFSNTNTSSSVIREVVGSGTYDVGTSGALKSAFDGGKPDTTASILAGTNSSGSTATLTMRFSDSSAASNDGVRRSDVFSLSGTTVVSGSQTDTFVIQLSAEGLSTGSVLAWNDSGTWVNAVTGNTGNNATSGQQGYLGSFSAFQTAFGSTLSGYIGAYGFDSGSSSVWAVVNHNSEFAAIPELSNTLAGLLIGAGLLRRRRN